MNNLNKLNKIIENSGLKKQFIAKKVGVTKQTISNWVLGKYLPNVIQAQKLSKILGLNNIDELIDSEDK